MQDSFKPLNNVSEVIIEETEDLLAGQRIHLRRGLELQVCHHLGKPFALVFLHGGLGNRFNWRFQYEFFAHKGKEVLAYDLGGHGQSQPYSSYSIGRHQRDLTRLLDYFQIQSPVLCCHSYGVPIGLEWARQHRVSGLVLVAGGTHNLAPWWEIPLMKFFKWGGRYLYHLPGVQYLTDYLSSSHTGDAIKQFLQESPVPTEYHAYEALEIFWQYNFFRKPVSEQFLQIPVLVMSGGKDPMFTYRMGENLANYFKAGEHLHLPEAGHLLIAEYQEMVNARIEEWIQTICLGESAEE